ncbi:hypothetical protein BH23ACT8_BH23ACT8_10170 [soil metagenome]
MTRASRSDGLKPPSRTSERGAAALTTTVAACLVLLVAGTVVGALLDLAVASARARTAADAAALAGAGASPLVGGDGDPCASAATVARANGGHIVGCAVTRPHARRGEVLRVAVTVRVPTVGPLARPLPDSTATATAAVLPADPVGCLSSSAARSGCSRHGRGLRSARVAGQYGGQQAHGGVLVQGVVAVAALR